MYLGAIILLMLVLPLLSVAAEAPMLPDAGALMGLIGKWFTFWGVGVRLFLAGSMQVFRPQFTAEDIFGIGDTGAQAIVREIGFGNLAIGTLGVSEFILPGFPPAGGDRRRPLLWARRDRASRAERPERQRAGRARLRLRHLPRTCRLRRQPHSCLPAQVGIQ